MSGTADEVKGRTKEAVGAVTDNDDLKHEGQNDQLAGKAKDKLDDAKDWAEDKMDDVKDRLDSDK